MQEAKKEEVVVPAVDIRASQSPSLTVDQSSSSPAITSDCRGPWPGYPDCGEKMQVMKVYLTSPEP